jgi:hypothetical protein
MTTLTSACNTAVRCTLSQRTTFVSVRRRRLDDAGSRRDAVASGRCRSLHLLRGLL